MYCNYCGKSILDDSVFCSYCGNKIKDTSTNTINSKHDLIIQTCQDCVKKHLKSPSTANFVNINIKEQDKYGRIYLLVELDAQNSFGASLRNQFHVVLQEVNEDGTYNALKDSVYKAIMFNTEDVVKKLNKWNKPK